MPLCSVCFQPECSNSTEGERPAASTHSTKLEPGERDYRGYIDWAVHPEEAVFVLHRGYAIVNGEQRHVYFGHNEAFVTQIAVQGSSAEPVLY
jgi:hypothetical protein